MNARNLTDFSAPTAQTAPAALLQARNASVHASGQALLQTCSAQFQAGQLSVILGPNGAGKSTLMSLLTGQRGPCKGQLLLDEQALHSYPVAELARLRACVAQETQVAFEFTVREVVELGRYPHRHQPSLRESVIVLEAMQAAAVDHLQERVLNSLSGGEKARVHLARALAQVWEPVPALGAPADDLSAPACRWLLLDEPTAALDLQHQHRVLQLLARWAHYGGVGVVAVLHDLNLALRYADHCVVLQNGEVAAAGPTRAVLTPGCIAQVWGVQALPVLREEGAEPQILQYVFGPISADSQSCSLTKNEF